MRAVNELHNDTRILINVLETEIVKKGKTEISYEVLSKAINRDVQKEARGLLATARKHVEQQHRVVIETSIKNGLKVVDCYTGVLDNTTKSIARKSRKVLKRIINVAHKIPDKELTAVNSRLSVMGAIAFFTKPKVTKKIESVVSTFGDEKLPTQQTLLLFTK